ncbi:unnamed protein product [Adineta steineri]|uniref:phospholipase D n=1 Tax=Adineta steineri TaxID=433720 RepID=A0A820HTI7_9BILA|nr:unnamed protein product [Adineta steineri]
MQKKDDGVRIYVMISKELSFVSSRNSSHTKQALLNKSKTGNIKVIRHPNHNRINNTLLWSHNEKSLIIDQKIAFIGGIDLCFGRWDNEFHRLVDLDETIKQVGEESMDTNKRYFIGKDYVNIYEGQIDNVERFGEDFIDRKLVPRTPWHDEALVVFGEVARDAARHFIQRWNIHKIEKFANDSSYSFILPKT